MYFLQSDGIALKINESHILGNHEISKMEGNRENIRRQHRDIWYAIKCFDEIEESPKKKLGQSFGDLTPIC